jgi:hypothetical protein
MVAGLLRGPFQLFFTVDIHDRLKSFLQLCHYIFRPFIIPPAEKRCLAQLLVFSPLGECDLADELRLDPLDFLGNLGGFSTVGLPVKYGLNRSTASANPFSLNPVPECPK